MKYKTNWDETREKFSRYWRRQGSGRPLMCVTAQKDDAVPLPPALEWGTDMADKYQSAERMVARYRHFCENHLFLGESFPNMSADFGPGSVAAYLGSDIEFAEDTVWFTEVVEDWEDWPDLVFNEQNTWFQKHLDLVRWCRALAGDDLYIGIPDLMENIDVLASLRGAQNTIFDMMDEPQQVQRRIEQVQAAYFEYYDRFYDIVKDAERGSCYTVFQIWGEGRTAKLQCDFSAMMSPDQYRQFIQQPLRQQAKKLDNVLYHLDGPDAIRHVPAVMEIEEIDALQWTSGDHGPDGLIEEWYPIYDAARAAGKGLWVKVYSGEYDDWVAGVDRLVARYGSAGLFLHFPDMPRAAAEQLLRYAEANWNDVKGTHGLP